MPITPPGGPPIIGSITIRNYDTSTTYGPSGQWEVEERVRVEHEDGEVWETKFTGFSETSTYKKYTFRDGPTWEPYTTADVTIKILITYPSTDEVIDKLYTLVFKRVGIYRIE
jgi:hypothetical protein